METIQKKAQTVLQTVGELITQKKATSCLANLYQEESTVKIPKERSSQVREQLTQLQTQITPDKCMSQPITIKVIEVIIKQLKCKKPPGPHDVTNDMIKHFGPAAKKTLIELFNETWKTGTVPALWEKSHHHPNSQERQRQDRPKLLSSYEASGLPWQTFRASDQQKIDIISGRSKILSPAQTG